MWSSSSMVSQSRSTAEAVVVYKLVYLQEILKEPEELVVEELVVLNLV